MQERLSNQDIQEVTFEIPYPENKKEKSKWCRQYGLNAYYSGKHWAVRKKDADFWHWIVRDCLIKQNIEIGIFADPVVITYWWNDNLDCSNHTAMGKMIEDALKGYLIKDDSKKYVKGIEHYFHSENTIKVTVKGCSDREVSGSSTELLY